MYKAIIQINEELPHILGIYSTREDAQEALKASIAGIKNPKVGGPCWLWIEETE